MFNRSIIYFFANFIGWTCLSNAAEGALSSDEVAAIGNRQIARMIDLAMEEYDRSLDADSIANHMTLLARGKKLEIRAAEQIHSAMRRDGFSQYALCEIMDEYHEKLFSQIREVIREEAPKNDPDGAWQTTLQKLAEKSKRTRQMIHDSPPDEAALSILLDFKKAYFPGDRREDVDEFIRAIAMARIARGHFIKILRDDGLPARGAFIERLKNLYAAFRLAAFPIGGADDKEERP